MSHLYAVSQGDLTGWEHITKFGINKKITSGALPATIWEFGGAYNWITTASPLELVSSSASDTFLGVGARTVLISGLDENWLRQTETVNLNGLTPVATTKSWLRINLLIVASAGTSLTNVGNLTLRSSGGGLVRDYIAAGKGIARTLVFSVPQNHDLLINLFAATSGDDDTTNSTIFVEARVKDNILNRVVYPAGLKVLTSGMTPYHHMADPPIFFGERTDYSWEATAASAAGVKGVGIYISASLVNNTLHTTQDTTEHPRW